MTPGIYWDMPSAAYHASAGLSNSGMKSLACSPLQHWFENIRPNREPREETPYMRLGTALHAAVLEPDTFLDRYACKVTKEDFTECLDTVAELKQWLVEHGGSTKGPNKPDYIKEALRIGGVKILDEEMRRHAAGCLARGVPIAGMLDKVEWEKVYGMAQALRREEALQPLLARGRKEVSIFVIDPETKALLKCRIDWLQQDACGACDGSGWVIHFGSEVQTKCTLCRGTKLSGGTAIDLKSFSDRGASIDDTVIRAIRYEGYIRQAWFYRYILKIAGLGDFEWVNAFVQSEAPYETRLRSMGPNLTKNAKYWEQTGLQCLSLIKKYADCQRVFGTEPWAYYQNIVPVLDSELPGLAFKATEDAE